jgi:hypothetical protein
MITKEQYEESMIIVNTYNNQHRMTIEYFLSEVERLSEGKGTIRLINALHAALKDYKYVDELSKIVYKHHNGSPVIELMKFRNCGKQACEQFIEYKNKITI